MAQKLINLDMSNPIEVSSRGKVYSFAFRLAEDNIDDLRVWWELSGMGKLPRSMTVAVCLKNPYAGANTVEFSLLTHPTSVTPDDFPLEKIPATERGLSAGYDPVAAQGILHNELEQFIWVQIRPTAGVLANPTDFVGWISFHDC